MSDNTTIINGVEYVQCDHCGQLVPVDQLHDVYVFDGDDDFVGTAEEWCDECVDTDAHECENCGDLVSTTREVRVGYMGRIDDWCPRCVDDHTYMCDRCGELHDYDSCVDVVTSINWGRPDDVERWCPDCADDHATECEDCGQLFSEDCYEFDASREFTDGNVRALCDRCVEDYDTCYECERLIPRCESYYDDDSGEYYCEDCYHRLGGDALHSYGHTHGAVFWQDDGTKLNEWELRSKGAARRLHLGVELETDWNDSAGELARDVMSGLDADAIECKRDGSLEDNGVEFVSQPMTPLYHLTGGIWEYVTKVVREHGGKSYDAGTCGLHIHISRAFFRDHDAVYRLDRLFHRFREQMVKFSRRTPSQLGHWCRLGDEHDDLVKIEDVRRRKEAWSEKKYWAGRYECVNDTNNATVEIRLWRGTLNMQTLRATIEFTTGLAIVANNMTDEYADELTWPTLKALVRYALLAEGIPTDDLVEYLKLRNL